MKILKLFMLATTSYIALSLANPTATCCDMKATNDTVYESLIVASNQNNDSSECPSMPADANSPGGEIV